MTNTTTRTLSSRLRSRRDGYAWGVESAREAIRENAPDYQTPLDALDGWGDHASEAAATLRVPERWRPIWRAAFEAGCVRVARDWLAARVAQ